ncbi:futalosine hydrolase [Evansella halocellulosilytica]|uniref:futalosine hydrolase n=1 Tax=Evansella halocellulosilytica TaxID=2011013 RepID=UPI000BB6AE91|nr:futalosine hydrolase [Evansella halocellulosilytica]
MTTKHEKVLIVTSVDVEKEAVLRGLHHDPRFDVQVIGVGPMNAAASTASLLSKEQYDLVVNVGIGGGFPNVAQIGSLVVSTEIVAADLGAETDDGFKPIEQLGFGKSRIHCDKELVEKLYAAMLTKELKVNKGPVLTLSTVTGTSETAQVLSERVRGAAVEAMEGFGVATAAEQNDVPVIEVRSVSNAVGPRDRGAWKINEALLVIEKASSVLKEAL